MAEIDKNRWYDDACGTAFALELIGERWAILIMRELMFGPRRFSELRRDLPGISANILTQRLERLERNRVLRKHILLPPASVQVYELTEWGYEAENLVQMLGKWATRHPGHDPSLPLSPASLMMSFRTMFHGELAANFNVRIGFKLGADEYVVHVQDGRIEIARQPAEEVNLLFTASAEAVAALVYGGAPLADLERDEQLKIGGDRALAASFVKLFILPEKLPELAD